MSCFGYAAKAQAEIKPDTPEYLEQLKKALAGAKAANDKGQTANALSKIMTYYANQGMTDELEKIFPETKRAVAQLGVWKAYYNVWGMKINYTINIGKPRYALSELKQMYCDARKRKDEFGLATAYLYMGNAYATLDNKQEAYKNYEKALQAGKNMHFSILLHYTYLYYTSMLIDDRQYDEALKASRQWLNRIILSETSPSDKYPKQEMLSYQCQRLECYARFIDAHVGLKNIEKAKEYIAKGDKLNVPPLATSDFIMAKSHFYKALGKYEDALVWLNKGYTMCKLRSDSVGMVSRLREKAELLSMMGRNDEAAKLYHDDILPGLTKINNTKTQQTIDELNSLAGVEELKLQERNTCNILYTTTAGAILLVLFLISVIANQRKMRAKNRAIYEGIIAKLKAEDIEEELALSGMSPTQADDISRNRRLYNKMVLLIREKQLYKNADISRDYLVEQLGINRNKFTEMMRECCTDYKNFSDFINHYRLRVAARMLLEDDDMSITQIYISAGFNSRTSFYTNFRECYGMTPSEYRETSKEKK